MLELTSREYQLICNALRHQAQDMERNAYSGDYGYEEAKKLLQTALEYRELGKKVAAHSLVTQGANQSV